MRRFQKGMSLFLFYLYFLGVSIPVSLLRNAIKGRFHQAGFILKGLLWNIQHVKIKSI
jgi:hypothetical protein